MMNWDIEPILNYDEYTKLINTAAIQITEAELNYVVDPEI